VPGNHKCLMNASVVCPDEYMEFLVMTDLHAVVSVDRFEDCGQFSDGEGWQDAETFF